MNIHVSVAMVTKFTEQGRKLVEYNRLKKEELKRLNDQITKQDSIDDKNLNR